MTRWLSGIVSYLIILLSLTACDSGGSNSGVSTIENSPIKTALPNDGEILNEAPIERDFVLESPTHDSTFTGNPKKLEKTLTQLYLEDSLLSDDDEIEVKPEQKDQMLQCETIEVKGQLAENQYIERSFIALRSDPNEFSKLVRVEILADELSLQELMDELEIHDDEETMFTVRCRSRVIEEIEDPESGEILLIENQGAASESASPSFVRPSAHNLEDTSNCNLTDIPHRQEIPERCLINY